MNRSCPNMQDRIIDYMLGALDDPQTQAVEGHLARCEDCRQYLHGLKRQGEALVELGGQVTAGMSARQDRVIQALQGVAPAEPGASRVLPIIGGFMRVAVAAVLVLGAGVVIGRMTAPPPVDTERLRADLEASLVASLKPALQEDVLNELDQRLQATLTASDLKLRVEVAEQIGRDLRLFASQFTAGSEQLMDRRFAELVEIIEAARLTDRRQVARALEQIRMQTGASLQSLAALTETAPTTLQN
jgi:hypothetical protein